MNRIHDLRSRGWILLVVAVAFVAGHLVLFHVLRRLGASHVVLPSAVVAGIVILIIAKHLGLLTALFRYVSARLRRGSQS
jgi:hypothetical protein